MSAEYLLPEIGTRVLCFLKNRENTIHWYEREVLDHHTITVNGDQDHHQIVVASADDPEETFATFNFVCADSDEGRHLLENDKAILLAD